MYYVEYLFVIYCRDLVVLDIEVFWIQVKFFINIILFFVIYRFELEFMNFFESFCGVFEKVWFKIDSIFIFGDFNCCLLNRDFDGIFILGKMKKLIEIFEDFNM